MGLSCFMMYLSYSPLTAPIIVAAATHHIHLLLLKSIFSFFPAQLIIYMEKIVSRMPAHWYMFSLSPKMTIAPTSVRTGRVALIGPTMVNGRCLRPKYPNIHDDSTMNALRITSRCACSVVERSPVPDGVVSSSVPANQSPPER